jgi:[acyl-carrier-protein] S-malonyltransferase
LSTAILFPGQGAQTVGMGKELIRISSDARERFSQASETLGFDLLQVCTQGPPELLGRTEYSQPALFTHSYAALELLQVERPDLWDSVVAVAGLSLGEYTAVAAGGGFSFEDGLKVVTVRGRAMQAASDQVKSGMASILGLSLEQVQSICQKATSGPESFVEPANLLCPGNIAISGHLDALSRAEALAIELGAMRAVRLQVAGAFHTELMQSAVAPLVDALEAVRFQPLRVPIYSNVDATPHSDTETIRQLLPKQVLSPVLWEETIRKMLENGIERFIEVGVGRVLSGTIKRINRKIPVENFGEAI